MTGLRGCVLLAFAVVVASACSSSSGGKPSTATTSTPRTTTTSTAVGRTNLLIAGVGPGVNETPFYPATTVTSVACGTSPSGPFVEITVPAGGPPTPAGSVLSLPTTVVVVAGKAVLKDHTGKVLYQQDMTSITTGSTGDLVLSLTNVSYIGGDRRSAETGAVDISGNFACPAASTPFPGI